MPEDYPFSSESEPQANGDSSSSGEGIPASVTFMEMMRQAAAKAAKDTPPPVATVPLPTEPSTPLAEPAFPQRAIPTEEALEEQRVQRVKRRKARRRRQTVGVLGGIVRSLIVVLVAAGLMATIFTWWTPSQFINDQVKQELSIAQATGQATAAPTIVPTPNWLRKIGIVAGHRGPQVPPDPGAVCPDGLTEAEITFAVAQAVVRNLRDRGYSVDLLDEFDPRLDNYQAAALVSIHANTCQNFGERVSGYLIARAASRSGFGSDDALVECVANYYARETQLDRLPGVTIDMTDYHSFREIHPLTPAAIIELGFLLADRDILTGKQTEMARGISDGILCFLEPGTQAATPIPSG
ncbi:MAG: N-acetylmuramoyl-L-alanine amidase [Anaerolineae bacterium]